MTHKFAIQILASECYFVTLLPRPFLQQHKRGGKDCKSAENQSYIRQDLETIREKVAHDDNDNNNRDETTVPSHFTLHFTNCNVIQ